ncbi:MAG: PD-(D/E)XK nuclease family protein [Deltaproteobacteria bacterium]|nr:PD-(D/E)XK nuclease family protein [Deltaproteobacteria bacterium]
MLINRVFLDWQQPFIQSVCEFVLKKLIRNQDLDLSHLIFITSGSRAGRRLLELFVDHAQSNNLPFVPPLITTIGRFPSRISQQTKPLAGEWHRYCLWQCAIEKLTADELALLGLGANKDKGLIAQLGTIKYLDRLYDEVAGAGVSFMQIAELGESSEDLLADQRWIVLDKLKNAYLQELEKRNLIDSVGLSQSLLHTHPERLQGKTIILVGLSELDVLYKQIFSALPAEGYSLVFAPEDYGQRFDEYGCVLSEKWVHEYLPLSKEHILLATTPASQAQTLLNVIKESRNIDNDQLVVGFTDKNLLPAIEDICKSNNLAMRSSLGLAMKYNEIFVFIEHLRNYISSSSFVDYAALIRLPVVEKYLLKELKRQSENVSAALLFGAWDKYQAQHLQAVISLSRELAHSDNVLLSQAHNALRNLLGAIDKEEKPLAQCCDLLGQILSCLYGDLILARSCREDSLLYEGSLLIEGEIFNLLQLERDFPLRLSFAETLSLILAVVGTKTVPLPDQAEAIEVLGWLELSHDDAPIAVLMGANEGFFPESVNADIFLPNYLRQKLGLLDNDLRFARDAFALLTMLKSKKKLRIIAGKESAGAERLLLSRLLLLPDARDRAEQILQFYNEATSAQTESFLESGKLSEKQKLLPAATSLPPHLAVTALGDYLKCPYRFYLKHILRLRPSTDKYFELDGAQIGALMHDIFSRFAQSALKDCSDQEQLSKYLVDLAEKTYQSQFGPTSYAIVYAQIYQLEEKLRAFAKWQTEHVKQGWRIVHNEYALSSANLELPWLSSTISLDGRIDRVDYNESLKRWLIIDYKVSENGKNLKQSYFYRKNWIDLQLPLYRAFLGAEKKDRNIKLAYLAISSAATELKLEEASWDEDTLLSAEEKTVEILQAIEKQIFWPANPDYVWYDDYREIVEAALLLAREGAE